MQSVLESLLSENADRSGGDLACWRWTKWCDRDGYGRVTFNGRLRVAHRVVYELIHGTLPAVVMHTCDTPGCVNPRHLQAGTQRENRLDCVRKGRTNVRRGSATYNAILSEVVASELKRTPDMTKAECKAIGAFVGCGWNTVYKVTRGERWTHP